MHAIESIEGIGAAIGQRLRAAGLPTAEHLLTMPDHQLEQFAEGVRGLSAPQLRNRIIPAARWISIGIDPQTAEGLAAGGYRSFVSLASSATSEIRSALAEQEASGVIPAVIDDADIESFRTTASRRIGTGALLATVRDGDGQPVSDASVTVVGGGSEGLKMKRTRLTDADGLAFLDAVTPGQRLAWVTADGYSTLRHLVDCFPDRARLCTVAMTAGPVNDTVHDEYEGGLVPAVTQHLTLRTDTVKVEDLPLRPPAVVKELDDQHAVLLSLLRVRRNHEVLQHRLRVPRQSVPNDVSVGAVLIANGTGDGWVASRYPNPSQYRSELARFRLQQGLRS